MIKSTKKIAVVIINYNGKDLLKKFLPSVVKYSDDKISDIYIIDNNSSDESVDFIKKNYSSVKIIQNDKNYGYAKGYNVGLDKIQSQYLVLINNDVEVTENWLYPMLMGLEQNKEIGSCQPKILSYENKNYFEAKSFCEWLSNKTGKIIRLPTEAEYEYASKGANHKSQYTHSLF